jgi:acyl carrier protein
MTNIARRISMSVLEEYGIVPAKILFLKPRTIGRTTSGKLQRKAFSEDYSANKIDAIFSWTSSTLPNFTPAASLSEDSLVVGILNICRFVLEMPHLRTDAALIDTGCDSITAMQILGEIESRWGVTLTLELVKYDFSVNSLALLVENALIERLASMSNDEVTKLWEELSSLS